MGQPCCVTLGEVAQYWKSTFPLSVKANINLLESAFSSDVSAVYLPFMGRLCGQDNIHIKPNQQVKSDLFIFGSG